MKLRHDAARNRQRVLELAEDGLTARKIARKARLHLDTVYRHLSRAGMSAVRPAARSKIDPERMLRLVRRFGVARAAKRLRVTRQAIYLRLKSAR